MYIFKDNPVGIDFIIDKIQKRMESKLDFGPVETEIYPRAYKNPKKNNTTRLIPEIYVGRGDYKEVFFDDRIALLAYFIDDDRKEVNKDGVLNTVISLIVHANLSALYPTSFDYRMDEELHVTFLNVFKNWTYKVQSIETGIKNVYKEFDISNVLLDDMSNQHVFRINLNATFELDCCENC